LALLKLAANQSTVAFNSKNALCPRSGWTYRPGENAGFRLRFYSSAHSAPCGCCDGVFPRMRRDGAAMASRPALSWELVTNQPAQEICCGKAPGPRGSRWILSITPLCSAS